MRLVTSYATFHDFSATGGIQDDLTAYISAAPVVSKSLAFAMYAIPSVITSREGMCTASREWSESGLFNNLPTLRK